MNTRNPDMPRLNAEDLERAACGDAAIALGLICNEEDCLVATNELKPSNSRSAASNAGSDDRG